MRTPTGKLIHPLLVLALVFLDRASKHWARTSLAPVYEIKVLPFFSLSYVENTGAAWGMMQGNNTLLMLVSLGLLGGLLAMRRTWKESEQWLHYGASLVIAGAVGNLYDRIAYKHVVDFLDFYWPGFYHWPVFNVADAAITVGAACLAWGLHLQDKAGRAKPATSFQN